MSVSLILPAPLRELAGGRAVVELDGTPATVDEALEALRVAWPSVHARVVTESGQVRPHINLFVGEEDVRHTGGLDTSLPSEARLFILPAVSGGRAVEPATSARGVKILAGRAAPDRVTRGPVKAPKWPSPLTL